MSKNPVIAVLGSRSFTDEAQLSAVLEHYIQTGQTVLTNATHGAALLTRLWCRKHGVPFQVIPAEWDELGRKAGPLNNAEIAEKCGAMIVFWDGGSPGAIDAAWKADMLGKNVLIVHVDQPTPQEVADWRSRLNQRFLRAS